MSPLTRPLAGLSLAVWLALGGCADVEPPPPAAPGPLAAGEARSLTLWALELPVERYEQVFTLEDLRRLPRATLDEVWLLDLDLTPLVRNALAALRDADGAALPGEATRNLQRLLRMSPLDVDFSATRLAPLLSLSGAIAIPAAQAVADLLGIGRAEPVIDLDFAAAALVDGLIASHPAAWTRPGPVDAAHPDGRWPVTPGRVPLTLGDVVDEFAALSARFGPAALPDGRVHPGFIAAAEGFTVVREAFEMRARVNANALPFKGLDLDQGQVASVNSLGSQIEAIFDVSDPEWLTLQGLVPSPTIAHLTVEVQESPQFFTPARTRAPAPTGDSAVWQADPWLLEPMIADMTRRQTLATAAGRCVRYTVGAQTQVFEGCIAADGWTAFATFNNLGEVPEPTYLWDLELEMAQVRLHDGGIPEGEATVAFTLTDVGLGVDSRKLVEEIKANLAREPRLLRAFAQASNETTAGAADVFYVPVFEGPEAGDWLWFVEPEDIPRAPDGERIRPYAYARPGFFADPELSQPRSARSEASDRPHHRVKVAVGDTLYVEDDGGRRFRLTVGDKPSPRRLAVTVTRLP